jgi:hypothetical protein
VEEKIVISVNNELKNSEQEVLTGKSWVVHDFWRSVGAPGRAPTGV